MYTRKKTKKHKCSSSFKEAIAILAPNKDNVTGQVIFSRAKRGLTVSYEIKGLSDGDHGFHIHQYGDLSDGCTSACAHFNPYGKTHGGLNSKIRHAGDLGNIKSKNGIAKGKLFVKQLSLNFHRKTCIIGRMIIVHADKDDLGKGGDAESLKTGNAGARVACGVIGLKS